MERLGQFLGIFICYCCFYGANSFFCVDKGNCNVKYSRKCDKLPFYSTQTGVYQQCCNLCASMQKCASVNYDVKTRQCLLLSDWSEDKELVISRSFVYGQFVQKWGKPSKNLCRARPCKTGQICVMTSSADSYVCLRGSVCSLPPVIDRMVAKLDFVTLSTGQAMYTCDTGYLPEAGSGLSVCSRTAGWTSPSLICKGVDCGSHRNLTNQIASNTASTLYPANVTYTCAVGYSQTEGEGTSNCQENGIWSSPTLKCEAVDCGNPSDISNMEKGVVSSTIYTSQVTFTCGPGFRSDVGDGTSVCQADGTWSVPTLHCSRTDCLTPPTIENMTFTVTSTLYESEAVYRCDVGYDAVSGSGVSVCQTDASWEKPTLICEMVGCGKPSSFDNMETGVVNSTLYESHFTYTCSPGFRPDGGDGTSVCQSDRTWSTPTLICSRMDCLTPTSIENMTFTVNSTLYESEAVYVCDVGYNTVSGSGVSVCQADASWEEPTLLCNVVDCGQPPNMTNMTKKSTAETTYQSDLQYACAVGYNEEGGDGTSSCQANGTWSVPTLQCSIVDCGHPPSYTYYEVASFTSTVYMSVAVYRCLLRYTSTENAESICLDTGQWSAFTMSCTLIPGIVSYGVSSVSNTSLECTTRLSDAGYSVSVACENDEVLTGCSALTVENTTHSKGQLIASNSCFAYGAAGTVYAVGRCCKQSGLQCEHVRLITETACVKDFQLLDCSCAAALSSRHCSTEHINNTCSPVRVNAPNNHNSYYLSLCCTSPGLSCYIKALDPQDALSPDLTIRCDAGHVMTGCSGYNTDFNIQGAVIQDVDGVDTCVISPGRSNVTTITGFAHCCTFQ